MKPFFKLAGSKSRVTNILHEHINTKDRIVVEPFAGTCSFSLSSQSSRLYLNDLNRPLIHLYRQLKHAPEKTIKSVLWYMNTPKYQGEPGYYALRDLFNRSSLKRRALIYPCLLMKCFNGLSRFNRSGKFNTPVGRFAHQPRICETAISNFAEFSKNAHFYNQSFEHFIQSIQKDCPPEHTTYMIDPPYLESDSHASPSFVSYSKNGFTLQQQEHLAEICRDLSRRGAEVYLTNHLTEQSINLYRAKEIIPFSLNRTISCRNRKEAKEGLFIF